MKRPTSGQPGKHRVLRTVALAAGAAMLSGPALAAAGDMSVAAFLAKADALKAKGPMALLSSDIGVLKAEGQAAGAAYKAQLDAERKAGHPSSCPPLGTRVAGDDLMAQMRTYPSAARSKITVKTAMVGMFRAKFPCRP
jgi:hypothetical protein